MDKTNVDKQNMTQIIHYTENEQFCLSLQVLWFLILRIIIIFFYYREGSTKRAIPGNYYIMSHATLYNLVSFYPG